MGKIIYQKDANGNIVYPVTIGDAVAVNGDILTNKITKLDGIEDGAEKNTVSSVAGKTGAVTLAKADVGLGNVENTALSSWTGSSKLTTAKVGTLASAATKTAGSASGNVPVNGAALGTTANVPVVTNTSGNLIPHASGALGSAAFTESSTYATAAQGEKADNAVVANDPITGATKCKITYDSKGLVTGGANLAATDIPSLAASKITSGTFADARIASAATWNAKQDALSFLTAPSSTNKVVTKSDLDAAVAGASNYLGTITAASKLSTAAKKGDFYRVSTAWTGVHVGDIIIAEKDSPSASVDNTNWTCLHNEANTDTTYTLSSSADKVKITPSSGTAQEVDVTVTTVNGHSVEADVPSGAKFTDTTYSSKAAASGGTSASLVTTGEKYTWNNKQDKITSTNKLDYSLISGTPTIPTTLPASNTTNSYSATGTAPVSGKAVKSALDGMTAALTSNTTTYDDSKIAAIVDVAAADTTIQ